MAFPLRFLDHSGEMAGRIRDFDWSTHPLGLPEHWSEPLQRMVDVALASSFPTAIYWGPEFRLLYNDAWAPIPAERHPWALGRPGAEVWAEIWDVVGPQMEQVVATGRGFATYDQMLLMARDGVPRETWWNYSFTPIRDGEGRVLGILNQGNETTRVVLAERARRAELERLRDYFQQAPGAIALLEGPEHRFVLANPAYLELVGRAEVEGQRLADALPEVIDQGYIDVLDTVYRTGEPYRAINRDVLLRRQPDADAERRVLDFVIHPVKTGDGSTSGLFLAVTDLTPRKQAEQAAEEAAEELRSATEAQSFLHRLAERQRSLDTPNAIMRLAVAELGRQLRLARVGFYRVAGEELHFGPCWTNGELPPLSGVMPVEAVGPLVDSYRQGRTMVMADTRALFPETQLSRVSPSAIGVPLLRGGQWVATLYANSATPREWTAEEIAFVENVVETSWDSVERADAVLALRESESKFRAIANSIDQMVWSTRADGYHDYYNDRWYEYTGVPYGSTDGTAWAGMFHPDDQARAWAVWEHCLATGELYRIEYRLRHHSGEYRWVLGRAQPVRDEAGRITRWFGTCTDIQEIVDAREVLARSREELEAAVRDRTEQLMSAEAQLRQAQKMEAVGQLTGGIAHDFNNMLAVVIGALDLLERRLQQGRTDLDRYIVAARDGATRAAALTQRLLAFSRQQPLAPTALDANEMIEGMIELLLRTLGEGVTIETRLARQLWPVLADRNQLENVVINLAVNGRDAMPQGGTLAIETANVTLDHAAAAAHEITAGDYVEIGVRDTGSGMAPDVAARAFDPFFTTKGVGKGTGLGLSQVFGFVRQSGGHVAIDTQPEQGTTVRIWLPAAPDVVPQPPVPEAERDLPRAKAGETVLVVEDEDRVRSYSVEALRELGYTVLFAHDGPEALRLLERGHPVSLLFSDVVMPEMSGRELARLAAERHPHLKILLTSGYAPDEPVPAEPNAAILAKPFDIADLAVAVRTALDGSVHAGP